MSDWDMPEGYPHVRYCGSRGHDVRFRGDACVFCGATEETD